LLDKLLLLLLFSLLSVYWEMVELVEMQCLFGEAISKPFLISWNRGWILWT